MTTAPAVDERKHIDVFQAAINAAMVAAGSPARCYGYDEVPGTKQDGSEDKVPGKLPNIFVLISLERRFYPPSRQIGRAGRSGWRLSLRGLGRSVDECQWALLRIVEAVEERRFTVDGSRSGPVQHESSTAPTWDDGRYSATKTFTYTL